MADHPDDKTARALAALDTMASLWAVKVNARNAIRLMMSLPDAEDRILAFVTQAHAEGLYEGRTSLHEYPTPARTQPSDMGQDPCVPDCPHEECDPNACLCIQETDSCAPTSEEYERFKAWCDTNKLEPRHDRWMAWQGARAEAVDTLAIEAMLELLASHNEVASYRSADGMEEYRRRRDRNLVAWMRVRDVASGAKPPAPKQWLWRVFNLGAPRGHEDSTNEWGKFNVISHADAVRLAGNDDNGCYQFVPFLPADPRNTGERNQCDGCAQGAALRGELHIDKDGRAFMSCQRGRYNSLT